MGIGSPSALVPPASTSISSTAFTSSTSALASRSHTDNIKDKEEKEKATKPTQAQTLTSTMPPSSSNQNNSASNSKTSSRAPSAHTRSRSVSSAADAFYSNAPAHSSSSGVHGVHGHAEGPQQMTPSISNSSTSSSGSSAGGPSIWMPSSSNATSVSGSGGSGSTAQTTPAGRNVSGGKSASSTNANGPQVQAKDYAFDQSTIRAGGSSSGTNVTSLWKPPTSQDTLQAQVQLVHSASHPASLASSHSMHGTSTSTTSTSTFGGHGYPMHSAQSYSVPHTPPAHVQSLDTNIWVPTPVDTTPKATRHPPSSSAAGTGVGAGAGPGVSSAQGTSSSSASLSSQSLSSSTSSTTPEPYVSPTLTPAQSQAMSSFYATSSTAHADRVRVVQHKFQTRAEVVEAYERKMRELMREFAVELERVDMSEMSRM